MKLDIVRADPAGNITIFVLTPVEKEQRGAVAEKLLALQDLAGEQVGYLCDPAEGYDGHLEMAGGEFCGNASRAFGMMTAGMKGLSGRQHMVLEVSGSSIPVEVDLDTDAGTARAGMPLPRFVCERSADGQKGILVHLGGIAHFVVDGVVPSEEFMKAAEREIFNEEKDLDAYGVMFYDSASGKLTPLVKVPAANSLYWEGSCGSGSLSTLIALTADSPDGSYEKELVQPAGCVRAGIVKENGKITAAWIGGSVTIDPPITVEI